MSNTARKIDGIYFRVKEVLSRPENKKRIAWGTIFGIILGLITLLVNISSPAQKTQAAPSQVVDGNSAYGTAFSMERKVVRTNLGPNGNRVFTLVTESNITMNLYYSDDAEAASPTWTNVGDINDDTNTNAPNWESSDMIWDTVNNNLWIVYGCITIADSNAYDLKYRLVTAIGTTPSLGAETDAMSASNTLTYSHPAIAIMGDSGTSKVVFFASEHYNGLATRNIAMRTITLDEATLGTTRVLDTAWTANANSGILGISRMNTDKNVLYYYNGTNMLATRHDDSSDVDATTGWDALNGTDASRTTISADDPTAPAAGSIAGDIDSDTVWFGWLDGAQDIGTCRWSTGTACDATAPAKITNAANTVGPALTTDGTTLYLVYTKNADASIMVYQSRTFSSGTGNWSGSETTIEDSAETSVTYPSISRQMYDGVVDVLFTTTTNYYIRHAMINTNSTPTLSVSQPDGTGDTIAENGSFNITYTLTDSDNTVTVDFYYDTNGSGLDGTSISACQDEVQGSGLTCAWDTTGIPPGSYYIYGITKDPSHVQVSAYSSGAMTINDKPQFTISQPDGTGDTVTVGQSYNVTYTLIDNDDTVTAAMYYDSNGSGLDGTAITGACASAGEGTDMTCSWDTTGMTPGDYYVYGLTSGDSINPQQNDYSPGVITINSANTAPNNPSSLLQKKVTGGATLATGDWTNETQVQFTATASDTDNPDTLYLCVEKDAIATAFSSTNGGDLCGTGVAYSGTPVTVSVTITGLTDATEFHWQAQVKDAASTYSSFVGYGGNTENPPTNPAARDFGTDTTVPTGGSVTDSANTGSLTQLEAILSGFDANVSGLNKYEYGIGTTFGGTDVKTWTDNGTSTTIIATGLILQTSVTYYFTARATDNATNVGTPANSAGQMVKPTLSFTLGSTSITFDNLNAGNSYHPPTKNHTLGVTTNAANGYSIYGYTTQLLTSLQYPSKYIDNYAGTWTTPTTWTGYGFGYTSSDDYVYYSNRFASGTKYSRFSQTLPGDIVADHTDAINGTTGEANDSWTITYQVATTNVQEASTYQTTAIYIVVPNY